MRQNARVFQLFRGYDELGFVKDSDQGSALNDRGSVKDFVCLASWPNVSQERILTGMGSPTPETRRGMEGAVEDSISESSFSSYN